MGGGAWWAAVHGVAESWTQLSVFTFTFHFHALEKEMATHSSVPAWRIPGTAEPVVLQSMGSHRVGHDWSGLAAAAVAAAASYHHTLSRMAKIWNTDSTKCWQECDTRATLKHFWWNVWKSVWQFLTKLRVFLPYNPAIKLLDIHPSKLKTMSTQKPTYGCL